MPLETDPKKESTVKEEKPKEGVADEGLADEVNRLKLDNAKKDSLLTKIKNSIFSKKAEENDPESDPDPEADPEPNKQRKAKATENKNLVDPKELESKFNKEILKLKVKNEIRLHGVKDAKKAKYIQFLINEEGADITDDRISEIVEEVHTGVEKNAKDADPAKVKEEGAPKMNKSLQKEVGSNYQTPNIKVEEFNNMGMMERYELGEKHPDLYKKLVAKSWEADGYRVVDKNNRLENKQRFLIQ